MLATRNKPVTTVLPAGSAARSRTLDNEPPRTFLHTQCGVPNRQAFRIEGRIYRVIAPRSGEKHASAKSH